MSERVAESRVGPPAANARLARGSLQHRLPGSRPPRPALPPGPYLVVGAGRAGRAAASRLEQCFGAAAVRVFDLHANPPVLATRGEFRRRGVRVVLGDHSPCYDPPGEEPPRCVIKSPGVPMSAAALREAAHRRLPVLDELELGWRLGTAPLIGVTGTNGKSTTSTLTAAALRAAGTPTVLAGNLEFESPLTAAAEPKDGFVVCEASSYQLDGCPELLADAAVFTGLTQDHERRHGSMEAYAACKRRLLVRDGRVTRLAVVCTDGEVGRALAREVEAGGGSVARYGSGADADYRIASCAWGLDWGSVEIDSPRGRMRLNTRLPGPHNALNVAAALALADALGLDPRGVVPTLEGERGVPGRFEPVVEGQPFDAVVDFAHNPDGLAKAMTTARQIIDGRRSARLRVALSAARAGDDPKRRAMGRIAAELADHVVLTSGNTHGAPRWEGVEGLLEGADEVAGARVEYTLERREAIRRAVHAAEPGDVVLVLGRGAMPRLLETEGGYGPLFDDRQVLREELRARR